MKVYYSGNYWGGHKFEHAGKEIPIKREFLWGGLKWHIPAIYACSKGFVIDYCIEIPKDIIENYFKRWNLDKRISGLSDEELEQLEKENPFSIDVDIAAKINGKELETSGMCAVGWHPSEVEREQIGDVQEELMEYYNCDRTKGWRFIRTCFPWKTSKKPEIKKLSLSFKERPAAYSGMHFTTEDHCGRQEITCTHPVSKQEYKITLYECASQNLSEASFEFNNEQQFPNCYKILTYSIFPDLSQGEFIIRDCARGDKPRKIKENSLASDEVVACGIAIIGGSDGPSAIFIAGKDSDESNRRMACSSLHFTQVQKVEWRTIFYVKENEDFDMDIIL